MDAADVIAVDELSKRPTESKGHADARNAETKIVNRRQ
jgi:hypothetical protein